VGCVIGCFSTALMTAAACYGLPAARVGTELLLERLRPYQNSNRIPVTIVDAALPHVSFLAGAATLASGAAPPTAAGRSRSADELTALVQAVSYCMQPERYPALRQSAELLLEQSWEDVRRYFKRKRLSLLDLPGQWPGRSDRHASGPARDPLRSSVRSVLGPVWTNRLSRTARGISRRAAAPARSQSARSESARGLDR